MAMIAVFCGQLQGLGAGNGVNMGRVVPKMLGRPSSFHSPFRKLKIRAIREAKYALEG
jgi:hypothetical protein